VLWRLGSITARSPGRPIPPGQSFRVRLLPSGGVCLIQAWLRNADLGLHGCGTVFGLRLLAGDPAVAGKAARCSRRLVTSGLLSPISAKARSSIWSDAARRRRSPGRSGPDPGSGQADQSAGPDCSAPEPYLVEDADDGTKPDGEHAEFPHDRSKLNTIFTYQEGTSCLAASGSPRGHPQVHFSAHGATSEGVAGDPSALRPYRANWRASLGRPSRITSSGSRWAAR
jgi:hypothetical protein